MMYSNSVYKLSKKHIADIMQKYPAISEKCSFHRGLRF